MCQNTGRDLPSIVAARAVIKTVTNIVSVQANEIRLINSVLKNHACNTNNQLSITAV